MYEPQALVCPRCRRASKASAMRRVEDVASDGKLQLEFYQCTDNECGLKVALWFELSGQAITTEQMSFVEQQVMRRGAFFPSDYGR